MFGFSKPGLLYARFSGRCVGFSEGTQKVLAYSGSCGVASVFRPDYSDIGFGCGTVHLHIVLTNEKCSAYHSPRSSSPLFMEGSAHFALWGRSVFEHSYLPASTGSANFPGMAETGVGFGRHTECHCAWSGLVAGCDPPGLDFSSG